MGIVKVWLQSPSISSSEMARLVRERLHMEDFLPDSNKVEITAVEEMTARPCPADNPDCDAQVYSSGDFVFCPKCGKPNPNLKAIDYMPASQSSRPIVSAKQQSFSIDPVSGAVKWS